MLARFGLEAGEATSLFAALRGLIFADSFGMRQANIFLLAGVFLFQIGACTGVEGGTAELGMAEQAAASRLPGGPFVKGGQTAYFHDEGFAAGFFHTYDRMSFGPSDAPRKVHVFVPRSYETSGRRYPILYVNDGDTAFFRGGAAGKTWAFAEALEQLYASGRVPEVIVVAVHPLDREREYTHALAGPGRPCCAVDGYADYLRTRIKPFVDASYRTLPDAAHTVIVGSSHGGLAAFYAAGRHPETFGNVVAMSSSFWVGIDFGPASLGDLRRSELWRRTSSTYGGPNRPKVYLDWGLERSGGFHNEVIEAMATRQGRAMATLLRERGYREGDDLRVVEDSEGRHDEDSWRRRLPDALAFVLGPMM